ncbi:cation transporter [Actinomadura rubrobrunea]|uniref:Cation transporter n=1 Tax=Actinomadura rubrobrunea TaxID=115335 RepID=A0A9W6UYT9_9ACTN|nr:cation diffusion facilitator family transporter [Actinomadura rubrobrunea]GLW66050.1 cation transporter [Actinomadura rubrobrunea]
MGAGHGHGHGAAQVTEHAGGRHRRRLGAAFVLIGSLFAVELAYGLLSGSLALLSDAGHMAADVVTLAAALVATKIAARRDTTGRRTYGSYRAEVFASGFAVLVMLGTAVYIVVEALGRIGADAEVSSRPMLVVGALGLVVNLAALALLRAGAAESLSVKGAYLEVLADTAGSVGVIAAGILVATTGRVLFDTVVALAIAVFVVVRALGLGRQVLAVLAQHAPAGLDVDAVAAELAAVPGVQDVHDLHLWTLTSGMNVATAHLVTTEQADAHAVLDRARELLRDRHAIAHATLQVEPADHEGCDEVGW